MYLTTDNAEKFLGVQLWQKLPGNHVQLIEVFRFPSGELAYRRLRTGVCSPVPSPQDKGNAVNIIKVNI